MLSGAYSIEESPLRNAPHTVSAVVNSNWDRKYSVEQAAFPVASLKFDKYFPPWAASTAPAATAT